ncbi:hypothetical protein H4R20_000997 [Coemansia guatemalensis]|uniref:Oxysterol-binding protein n=1 Tax=Coemansia guatemalensis TaxID=2761395 RepID=A0A9W8I467_9FUNG|nr:hypothetical protein H4R20_000997 [Coemansia guatemalensis]
MGKNKGTDTTPRNSLSADSEVQRQKHIGDAVEHTEEVHIDGEQSKFSAILGILRKLIGVADVINLRLSLPSQLLDPIPNLEYWNYMDSPEHFVAITEPDDEVERMLAMLAWWFSKLLKHTGKVHKPFNSVLGEQFFCKWEVDGNRSSAASATAQAATGSASGNSSDAKREDTAASSITNVSDGNGGSKLSVEYITEQVSHHPPVSAFVYRCKERGIEAVGMDHIAAKFTGLSATVATGSECHGIFVTLKQRNDEMYKCTHPVGSIVGWMRGTLKVQLIESSYIVCAKTGLAAIIEFKEERWFGKNKGNVTGKVFRYDEKAYGDKIAGWRLKDIPKTCTTVATFGGNWDQKVMVERVDGASKDSAERLLIDMTALEPAEKQVKPVEEQGEMESRRIWGVVASKMLEGKFGEATRIKRGIEDEQRALAAARKERAEVVLPALFKPGYSSNGKPELLDDAPINI